MKVTVLDNKTGKEKAMAPRYAKIFAAMGRGRYTTRDMVAAPFAAVVSAVPVSAPAPAPAFAPAGDEKSKSIIQVDGAEVALDDLDAAALHELAKKLGVKVHHASGSDKVRAALLEAQGATSA